MFTTPLAKLPPLKSDNFELRPISAASALSLFSLYTNPKVTRFYDLPHFTDIAQVDEMIAHFEHLRATDTGIRWGIFPPGKTTLIGTCGYNRFSPENRSGDISFDLAPEWWKGGVMTEILPTVIAFSFNSLNLKQINAQIIAGNTPSIKLLTRLGFVEQSLETQFLFNRQVFVQLYHLSLFKQFAKLP